MSEQKKETDILMHDRTQEHLLTAVVREITWERIWVTFEIEIQYREDIAEQELEFYAVTGFGRANARFESQKTDSSCYRLLLNVTNPGYLFCLPTAEYAIYVCSGRDILDKAKADIPLIPRLDDCSRAFLHNNFAREYCVNFMVSDTEEELILKMKVMDAAKKGLEVFALSPQMQKKKRKQTFVEKILRRIIKKIKGKKRPLLKKYYSFCRKHRPHTGRKNILFMSEQNEKQGDNLACVYERMKERGIDKDFDIRFSARATVARKYGLRSWLHVLKLMAEADLIFVDDHCPVLDWLTLKKDTVLVQMWHAGAGYKSVGYSRWGHRGAPDPVCCHRQYTYCITPSRKFAHFFSEQFGINSEQIIPTGMPRMDAYLNEPYREKTVKELYEKFPVCRNKKVVLFAPTYRGMNRKKAYYPYDLIDFRGLQEYCGEDKVILFKMHPWVEQEVPIPEEYLDCMLDVSRYSGINDLFYITDLLITDYSSSVMEFSLMKKPMLFYAFDKIQYSFSRGFHRSYDDSVPGKICETFEELLLAMNREDYEFEKLEGYLDYHFDHIDTGSSDRVIDWLILDRMPEEIRRAAQRQKEQIAHLKALDFRVSEKEETMEEET